jgi:hypothetical protein
MGADLNTAGKHERYFDCGGREILPRCRDNEIILRDADNYPQCIAIGPPPSCPSFPLVAPLLGLALVVGIIAGRQLEANRKKS